MFETLNADYVHAAPIIVPLLTARVAADLLAGRATGVETVETSLDLGLSQTIVALDRTGAAFPGAGHLPWEEIEARAENDERCYALLDDGELWPVGVFSETTGWYRSLIATDGTPTTLVGGFTMHRMKRADPMDDTREKIRAIRPVTGRVLDTATGLGYTAIEAAQTADHLLTVEVDPAAIEIIRYNPWSHELLTRENITAVIADIYELIQDLDEGSFDRIIHDPPTLSLAGELYSEAFYRECYRVLARRGRLFHYVGDPASRSGRRTTEGVIRRLQAAGFERVRRAPKAYGVVAFR